MSWLAVTCTDRGQHRERKIGWLGYADYACEEVVFRPWLPNSQRRQRISQTVLHTDGEPRPEDLLRLVGATAEIRLNCPTCRRDMPLTQRTARRWLEACTANNLSRLDVSLI